MVCPSFSKTNVCVRMVGIYGCPASAVFMTPLFVASALKIKRGSFKVQAHRESAILFRLYTAIDIRPDIHK
jgi:hypothetical protein